MNTVQFTTTPSFDTVYKIDINDRTFGGDLGAVNIQTQQLANRDEFLNDKLLKQWSSRTVLDPTYNACLAINGYQKLPSGLIMQWGQSPNPATQLQTTVTFPIPFPTACLNVSATVSNPTGNVGAPGDYWTQIVSYTNINVVFVLQSSQATGAGNTHWFAVGH